MHVTEKTFFVVDYQEVDRFINEHYKPFKPATSEKRYHDYGYECVSVHEWGNDSSHELMIGDQVDEYAQKEIADWLSGNSNYTPSLETLLGDQCAKGNIKPGKYLVEVCW